MVSKEEQIFCKRLQEFSKLAYYNNQVCYTDFLNLNEMNLFYQEKRKLFHCSIDKWGGYEGAECCILCFQNEEYYESPKFPISCIQILPVSQKFSDTLTHRDFLGAILNLGIERNKIGDIFIKQNQGYLFCKELIAEFIIKELEKVKHTIVTCSIYQEEIKITPDWEQIHGTVAALRLDSLIALAFQTSRNSLRTLPAQKKVFINGKMTESNGNVLKEGDIVSVRGFGKFIFKEVSHQTKKGRYAVTILKYI